VGQVKPRKGEAKIYKAVVWITDGGFLYCNRTKYNERKAKPSRKNWATLFLKVV